MERGIKGTVRKKRTEIYPRTLRSRKINCSFMANDFCLSALDDVIPLNITKSTNNKNEYEDFYALTTKLIDNNYHGKFLLLLLLSLPL